MLTLAVLFAGAVYAAPPEPLAGQFRAAIWQDLQANGLIGNGDELANLWINAGSNDPNAADLHLQALRCRRVNAGYRCTFSLFRDGGEAMALGQVAPNKLECEALLVHGNGWAVRHLPPRHVGHSRSAMRCERAKA